MNPLNQQNMPPLLLLQTYSAGGNMTVALPKTGIHTVKFVGSAQADTFQLNTFYRFDGSVYPYISYTPILGNLDGRGGNDSLTGGIGADRILGGTGHDDLWGKDGNDTIEGGSGLDDIYGGKGNDVLRGGSEEDWIEGNEDHDQLTGGSGTDFLYGGSGIDGLFGGNGVDHLHGGPDPDRFLIRTKETGTFSQTFDGVTLLIADWIQDDTTQDIRVRFTDEGARTLDWGEGVSPSSTSYTAGSWSDGEIELADQAMAYIATATANNALLYKPSGGEPQMYRLGNASNEYVGFNDTAGDTHYSNQSFTWNGAANDDWATQVVLHEIGHNWDTAQEADRLIAGWGAAVVDAFRDNSSWTQTRPSDASSFTQSRDDQWWYTSSSEFVRWYARTNPREDFAETFSAYFMDAAGRAFVDGVGAAGAAAKVDMVDAWITLASYLGPEGRPVGAGGTWGNASAASAAASPNSGARFAVGLAPPSSPIQSSIVPSRCELDVHQIAAPTQVRHDALRRLVPPSPAAMERFFAQHHERQREVRDLLDGLANDTDDLAISFAVA
jgi:hypothetical protein